MKQIIKKWSHCILLLLAFSIPKYQRTHATEKNEDKYFVWIEMRVQPQIAHQGKSKTYQFFVSSKANQKKVFNCMNTRFIQDQSIDSKQSRIFYIKLYSQDNDEQKQIAISKNKFKESDDTMKNIIKNAICRDGTPVQYERVALLEENPLDEVWQVDHSTFSVITSDCRLVPFSTLLTKENLSNAFIKFSFAIKPLKEIHIFASIESDPLHVLKKLASKIGIKIGKKTTPNRFMNLILENLKTGEFTFFNGTDKKTVQIDMFFKNYSKVSDMLKDELKKSFIKSFIKKTDLKKVLSQKQVITLLNQEKDLYKKENTVIISKAAGLEKEEFIKICDKENDSTLGTQSQTTINSSQNDENNNDNPIEKENDNTLGTQNDENNNNDNDDNPIDKENDSTLGTQSQTTINSSQNDENNNDNPIEKENDNTLGTQNGENNNNDNDDNPIEKENDNTLGTQNETTINSSQNDENNNNDNDDNPIDKENDSTLGTQSQTTINFSQNDENNNQDNDDNPIERENDNTLGTQSEMTINSSQNDENENDNDTPGYRGKGIGGITIVTVVTILGITGAAFYYLKQNKKSSKIYLK